ncbi:sensor histidine kinase [Propionimicrobium lymphophilum]|uniref:sensor histidine kinase n=1 Tax=Propionimicrobium lymphophilum TaxID=33012 RepID=UPI000491D9AD|nr:ATP-binding protein [Propionimicrobium lymphophilum]
MNVWVAALLGLFVGVVACAIVVSIKNSSDETQPIEEPALSEQTLNVVDLLRSAAIIVDAGDQVIHATSAAQTSGLIRGNRIKDQEMLDLVRKVREKTHPVGTNLTIRRGLGQVVQELAIRAVQIDEGMVIVIADDRTAQARADEIKRDFTTNVSHELKTPVGALQVLSEAVMEAADDPEAVRHFATRMSESATRLGELVRQIIELSRLQSNDPLARAEIVEVDDVTSSAIDQCKVLADDREVHMSTAGRRGLQVLGDATQLTSALTNLIQNAINYSDKGSRIAVSTRFVNESDDEFVEISVADNGIGIEAEEMDRIFERFYRVDYARSRATGGTGLGLSIVKHVMNAHGGTVNVWSKPGQGSTFTMRLPKYIELVIDNFVAESDYR